MAKPTEQSGESFMLKLARFIVDKRNLVFLIVIIGLIFSVFSRSWVQVESDLTAYLPADSETRQALDIMDEQFTTFGTASVMVANLPLADAFDLQEQLEAIRTLQRAGLLAQLPDKLQLTAALRLENPELPLSELAEEFDPPVTKSCLNHRLRKLMELAKSVES